MKKITLIIAAVAVAFISCERLIDNPISVEASSHAEQIARLFYPSLTKSWSCENVEENELFTVVNFKDNEGFVVESFGRILAVSEKGNIDSDKLSDYINDNLKKNSFQSDMATIYINSTDLPYGFITSAFLDNYKQIHNSTKTLVYPDSLFVHVDTLVSPICKLKWGQSSPFNMQMPLMTPSDNLYSDPKLHHRWPVGCGPIATAMLIVTNNFPTSLPDSTGTNYTTSQFLNISNYRNAPLFDEYFTWMSATPPQTQLSTIRLSKVLLNLNIQLQTYFVDTGTATNSINVKQYLKDLGGIYSNVQIKTMADGYNSVKDILLQQKPVIIAATSNSGAGHAWLIDGYASGESPSDAYPDITYHSEYLHFNWGLWGFWDGYYLHGRYSTANYVFKDRTYDICQIDTLAGPSYEATQTVLIY